MHDAQERLPFFRFQEKFHRQPARFQRYNGMLFLPVFKAQVTELFLFFNLHAPVHFFSPGKLDGLTGLNVGMQREPAFQLFCVRQGFPYRFHGRVDLAGNIHDPAGSFSLMIAFHVAVF